MRRTASHVSTASEVSEKRVTRKPVSYRWRRSSIQKAISAGVTGSESATVNRFPSFFPSTIRTGAPCWKEERHTVGLNHCPMARFLPHSGVHTASMPVIFSRHVILTGFGVIRTGNFTATRYSETPPFDVRSSTDASVSLSSHSISNTRFPIPFPP